MLLPSGVSSASEARVAARASSSSVTPLAGRNEVAWRLPSVIVPPGAVEACYSGGPGTSGVAGVNNDFLSNIGNLTIDNGAILKIVGL